MLEKCEPSARGEHTLVTTLTTASHDKPPGHETLSQTQTRYAAYRFDIHYTYRTELLIAFR